MMVRFLGIFFHVTVTTKIYSYRHKFFRHDALPISSQQVGVFVHGKCKMGTLAATQHFGRPGCRAAWRKQHPADARRRADTQNGADVAGVLRSVEHTSELQLLMRISYAVFCLSK